MHHGRRKRSESNPISHSEECAQIQIPGFGISILVELEVGIDDGGSVISRSINLEELVRIYGKVLCIISIEPITNGYHYIHYKEESDCNIRGGKPWASQRTTEV